MPRAKRHQKMGRADTIRAILWTAQQLDETEIEGGMVVSTHLDPPPMAASLLAWVAKSDDNRTIFYTRMLPKAMPPEATLKQFDENEADAAAAHTNKLRAWLKEMEDAA